MTELLFQRLHEDAVVPERAYAGDAGLDLVACEGAEIGPGERAVVGTGLAVAIPEGHAGFVQPRSGLAADHGVTVLNTPGLIDSGYRGEVRVILLNTDTATPFVVEPGMRIAQLVVVQFAPVSTRRGGRAAFDRARRARVRILEPGGGLMGTEPRIRVSAILSWGGRILLCRHEKHGRAYWLLPGGGVNSGESLVRALHRELEEEVGINDEIPVEGPVAIVDSIAPERSVGRETRRPHHLLRRPGREVARGGDLAGRGRSRAQAVRRG